MFIIISNDGLNLTNSFTWLFSNLKEGILLHFFFGWLVHWILVASLLLRFLAAFSITTLCGASKRIIFIIDIVEVVLTLRLSSIWTNFDASVFFFFNLDKLTSKTFLVTKAKFCDVAWRFEILNELLLGDINWYLRFSYIYIIVFYFIIIHRPLQYLKLIIRII